MSAEIDRLLYIMERLRDPKSGCPWDIEQNFKSITKYTIEETYEVVDAIEREDFANLKEELGDLLLQVVFYAQMAREQGLYDFYAITAAVADKMVKRHPHVFGNDSSIKTSDDLMVRWEADKAKERLAQGNTTDGVSPPSALDGVIGTLPAMARAVKLQQRAARVGFDWVNPKDILDKIDEETKELKDELDADPQDLVLVEEELGDVLFVLCTLARRLKIDPEGALRAANRKFERRFRGMEALLATEGKTMEAQSPETQESLWQEVKKREKSGIPKG